MPSPKLDFLTTGYGPLVQVIYDRISNEILDLRRLNATTLIMEDVAEEHGATMMNVHRAFETLSSDGLVCYDHTCGTATVHFGESDVIELTRSRFKLESRPYKMRASSLISRLGTLWPSGHITPDRTEHSILDIANT